jgi:long-chain acyl-CoA synthetase
MGLAVQFSTITEMFDNVTKKFSAESRPMLMYKTDKKYCPMSYGEFRRKVEMFSLGLASLGIKKNDTVAIISENRPEWIIADMAIVALGAVDVPIYPTLTAQQIQFICEDADVKIAIVSNQSQVNKVLKIRSAVRTLKRIIVMSDKVDVSDEHLTNFSNVLELGAEFEQRHPKYFADAIARVKQDDLLTIIYTSGTTGNPKGVMLSHRNLVSNMHAAADVIPISSDDVFLSFLPLCHTFERMGGYYTAMACGTMIAYAESPETVRDNILEIRPTIVTTVPRLFERIYNRLQKQMSGSSAFQQKVFYWAVDVGRKYAASKRSGFIPPLLKIQHTLADRLVFQKMKERVGGRMRFFVSGGGPLPRELGEFFEAVGIVILEGYGLTEASPVLSVNRIDDYRFGSVGKPVPGVEIKIANDGEILAKGPNVMMGYYKNKKATDEVIDSDGWLHTGDIGVFDAHGMLMITDRKKHLFVSSGGKKIAPQPIENLFLQSKYIDQFVLIGDKRMFLSALIVPDFDAIQEYADKNNIAYSGIKDLAAHSDIYSLIEKDIQALQKNLANFERVRKFVLLEKQFSLEDGEITPTLKIKRNVVEQRYGHLIEEMYRHVA